MATDELNSITGLEDKHRRALARRQITALRSLADADQRVIYNAMGSIRPRPTLEQIAQWQGEARAKLGEPAADTADWHTAASFAVVFARRRVGDTWERRLEVERTEVEPEREPEVWAGWECDRICGWMRGQLDQANGAGPGQGDQAGESRAQPAGAQPAGGRRARARGPQGGPGCMSAVPRSLTRPGTPRWLPVTRWWRTRPLSLSRRSTWSSPSAGHGRARRCMRWPGSVATAGQAGTPRIRWSFRRRAGPSSACPASRPAGSRWPCWRGRPTPQPGRSR